MRLGANSRLAWAIAFASVALWAATAPATLGGLMRQSVGGENPAYEARGVPASGDRNAVSPSELQSGQQAPAQPTFAPTPTIAPTATIVPTPTIAPTPTLAPVPTFVPAPPIAPTTTVVSTPTSGPAATPTLTPTIVPTATPQPSETPTPVTATALHPSSGDELTFVLCGEPDPQAERAIEQLIDGRSFKAKLSSRPDGCADLTIAITSQSPSGVGRQSISLTVSAGSTTGTPNHAISVRIVNENGVTKATIGAAR